MMIGDNHYFDGISSAEFPPLYNENAFEEVFDDFLAIVEEPEYETPGQSFNLRKSA
jgi:hypothetical protein